MNTEQKYFTDNDIAHTMLMLRERPDRMDASTRNKAANIIEALQEYRKYASAKLESASTDYRKLYVFSQWMTAGLCIFAGFLGYVICGIVHGH